MYMFTFAFLGNCFYVASVIFSPEFNARPPTSTAFIRESIPYATIYHHSSPLTTFLRYLIGSGGTLVFDITIVTQSFIYTPKLHHRGRRSSVRRRAEEEAGLLSGDALAGGSIDSFSKTITSPSNSRSIV
jgi:solute carrier family 66 (lysosomal lysine-arginine transporter), member 1